ncbi:hypothetical protein G3R49_19375 [Shewanella sp. WXL01]|uniref:hypothetical protein n=1 Tax=Shewanella sp. WXL01 TaxID=2709721 RepID=UPI00143848B3|nr:hypothetical protein [Shewanella sp. WXL01]NKF52721.1 hypothetical protein [Shewanella sp. WXL01]
MPLDPADRDYKRTVAAINSYSKTKQIKHIQWNEGNNNESNEQLQDNGSDNTTGREPDTSGADIPHDTATSGEVEQQDTNSYAGREHDAEHSDSGEVREDSEPNETRARLLSWLHERDYLYEVSPNGNVLISHLDVGYEWLSKANDQVEREGGGFIIKRKVFGGVP